MKSFISSVVGITFVIVATTATFAGAATPTNNTTVHMDLSDADALRLLLALRAEQGDGH